MSCSPSRTFEPAIRIVGNGLRLFVFHSFNFQYVKRLYARASQIYLCCYCCCFSRGKFNYKHISCLKSRFVIWKKKKWFIIQLTFRMNQIFIRPNFVMCHMTIVLAKNTTKCTFIRVMYFVCMYVAILHFEFIEF